MMWIKSIKLYNFKSYAQGIFRFPEPAPHQNLVLVGAKNGYGKTTLLEAIYFCLYDDDAIRYLTRAGLNNEEIRYPDFLNQALHHQAQEHHGQFPMLLQMEICKRHKDKVETLEITRKWFFNKKRVCDVKNADSRETRVRLIDGGGVAQIIPEEEHRSILNTYALPFEYAPFFFFDGEKIVQAAASSGTGLWLNQALQGLLGVTLLHRLKDSLSKYRTQTISESASKKMQAELHQAQADFQAAEAVRADLQEQWEALHEQKILWETKRNQLTQEMGGAKDLQTVKQLIEEKVQLEQEQAGFSKQVDTAFLEMPLAMLPENRMNQLAEKLRAEAERLDWETGRKKLSTRVDDFWHAFKNSPQVRDVMGEMAEFLLSSPKMKEALRECWDKLFDPLPLECAKTIEHNYLSEDAYGYIRNEISKLKSIANEPIDELIAKIEQHQKLTAELDSQIEILRSVPRHDERVANLKEASDKASELVAEEAKLAANLEKQNQQVEQLRGEVDKLQAHLEGNDPKLRKSQRAGKIEKMIDDLSQQLLAQKVQSLGEVATRINRQLSHDRSIDKIEVSETGKMSIFSADRQEIQAALSAGQMQILIMSLVSALAEVTHYHAPSVIDTPLARLDVEHRQNLFKHWSSLPQQVILLAQDSEITSEIYQQLSPYISKTYLVEAVTLTSGGKTSVMKENQYF